MSYTELFERHKFQYECPFRVNVQTYDNILQIDVIDIYMYYNKTFFYINIV